MTIETMAAPGAAAENLAPESAETPEVATPDTSAQSQAPQTDANADKGDDADRSLKRLQRRVDRVTAARYQAEARAQQAEAELSRYRQQAAPQDAEAQPVRPEDIDRLANQRADEITTARQLNERSNAVFQAGTKAFGDTFQQSIAVVIDEAGPLIAPNGRATPLGEAILDAEAPAQVLHHLAQHPEIAEQLRDLTPAQLGRRIARIEAEMSAKPVAPKPSNAPKPITPVRGASAPQAIDPSDTRRWIEAENARQAGRK